MITVKRNTKKYNEFKLTATLTLGKIEAIKRALELYKEQSAVANDVYVSLKNVMEGVDTSL